MKRTFSLHFNRWQKSQHEVSLFSGGKEKKEAWQGTAESSGRQKLSAIFPFIFYFFCSDF
jgi:hypothetical protein